MKQFAEIVNTIMRECLVLKDHTKTCINIRAHEVYPKLLKYLEDLGTGQCRALDPKLGVVVGMLDYVFDAAQVVPTKYKNLGQMNEAYQWHLSRMNCRPIDVLLISLLHSGFKIVHECGDKKYNWESVGTEPHLDPTMVYLLYKMRGVEQKMLISRRLLKTKFMSGQWKFELA